MPGTGLVLAAWPILEVTAVSGTVAVENEWGRVSATPGGVVFAPSHWLPVVRGTRKTAA